MENQSLVLGYDVPRRAVNAVTSGYVWACLGVRMADVGSKETMDGSNGLWGQAMRLEAAFANEGM